VTPPDCQWFKCSVVAHESLNRNSPSCGKWWRISVLTSQRQLKIDPDWHGSSLAVSASLSIHCWRWRTARGARLGSHGSPARSPSGFPGAGDRGRSRSMPDGVKGGGIGDQVTLQLAAVIESNSSMVCRPRTRRPGSALAAVGVRAAARRCRQAARDILDGPRFAPGPWPAGPPTPAV
jgi:hypothetical protein